MAKRKKKKAKRRRTPEFLRTRNENRLGMTVAVIAIMIMTGVVGVNSISLTQKEQQYAARERELMELIEAETARAGSLRRLPLTPRQRNTPRKLPRISLGWYMKMRLSSRKLIRN